MPEQDKARMKQVYNKEMETYASKLAKVPQEVLDNAKDNRKSKRMLKEGTQGKKEAEAELKSLLEKLKKPMKPNSAYISFSKERRPHLSPNLKPGDRVKELAKEWNQASPETKEKYNKAYARSIAKYEKDLEKWVVEMKAKRQTEKITAAEEKLAKAKRVLKENHELRFLGASIDIKMF